MLNITMRYIWTEERDYDYFFPNHSHYFYEMAYYTAGSGLLTADNSDYSISEGYYAIVPPGMTHCETQYLNSKKFCIAFYCDEKFPFIFQKDFSKNIYRVIDDIYRERQDLQYYSKDFLSAKLNEMFVYITHDNTGKQLTDSNFEYIINTMEEKLEKKICLQEYAKQLNISYEYFRHKFKKITGLSPKEYIINRRLETACALLTTTNYTCTEISEKCGFSDSAQFSRMFKEKYKISPIQYRKCKNHR